jgi:H+/gluconate symporter-like permease
MSDPHYAELLGDALSKETRKERRNVLVASLVGFAVATMDIVPAKLSALGIEFNAPAQSAFLILIASAVAYFLVAFCMYGLADFFVWKKKVHDYEVFKEQEIKNWSQQDQLDYDEIHESVPKREYLYRLHPSLVLTRMIWELVIPIVLAISSMWVVIAKRLI